MQNLVDLKILSDGLPLPLRRYEDEDAEKIELPESQLEKDSKSELIAVLKARKLRENEAHDGRRTPLLMLHGASAARETFEFPRVLNLVNFLLLYTNLEPWLLDWRGSRIVTDPMLEAGNFDDSFTFDEVAETDIPRALERIRAEYPDPATPLRALGHCMGAANLARAVAWKDFPEGLRPTHIVLSTIGLFFEVPVDGRIKASDRLLERVRSAGKTTFIDPICDPETSQLRNEWPDELDELYETWPDWLKPHASDEAEGSVLETCNRLSFMYGEPYYEPALRPEMHDDPTELPRQFGAIPLSMYVHAAQCVRKGWAVRFDFDEDEPGHPDGAYEFITDDSRKRFEDMHVTLLTGALNRLWHRDSVDRMYEWLQRGPSEAARRHRKIIFRNYGHQDLLWGRDSWDEVYPRIADGLTAEAV